jgi:hypothetical protein
MFLAGVKNILGKTQKTLAYRKQFHRGICDCNHGSSETRFTRSIAKSDVG